jgi:hypothetical protein
MKFQERPSASRLLSLHCAQYPWAFPADNARAPAHPVARLVHPVGAAPPAPRYPQQVLPDPRDVHLRRALDPIQHNLRQSHRCDLRPRLRFGCRRLLQPIFREPPGFRKSDQQPLADLCRELTDRACCLQERAFPCRANGKRLWGIQLPCSAAVRSSCPRSHSAEPRSNVETIRI